MGARGNSGVILSQILRGLCETFRTAGRVGPAEVAAGLDAAADAAYAAVMHPVEGTILTVVRASADAAVGRLGHAGRHLRPDGRSRAGRGLRRGRPHARAPPGARARRVSSTPAGAASSLFFDAWLHVLDGRPLPEPRVVAAPPRAASAAPPTPAAPPTSRDRDALRGDVPPRRRR